MKKRINQIKKVIKSIINYFSQTLVNKLIHNFFHINSDISYPETYDFIKLKNQIRKFKNNLSFDEEGFLCRFSKSSPKYSLYATVYSFMTSNLLGDVKNFSLEKKNKWTEYFDSFQREDGFFVDNVCETPSYFDSDWWGARHLALHMISAYSALDSKPKYEFFFLREWYGNGIDILMDELDSLKDPFATDIDNKIGNIGGLLQYQRDFRKDQNANVALEKLKKELINRIDKNTGLWFSDRKADPENPYCRKTSKHSLSREIQFAYHLLQIFFYDKNFNFEAEKIIKRTLETQNAYGGYGVLSNSSACEDIDSIDLLIRFYPFVNQNLKSEIKDSINKGFSWVIKNQMSDGGFTFRLFSNFTYGHKQLRASLFNSNMMATWFRLLSIAYITRFLGFDDQFSLISAPGYEH